MLLRNPQGCEIELNGTGLPRVKKVILYPTGSIQAELITKNEAQALVIDKITNHAFKIIF